MDQPSLYQGIRRALQLSAKELADLLGVSEAAIYKRESGESKLRKEHWLALDRIALSKGAKIQLDTVKR